MRKCIVFLRRNAYEKKSVELIIAFAICSIEFIIIILILCINGYNSIKKTNR